MALFRGGLCAYFVFRVHWRGRARFLLCWSCCRSQTPTAYLVNQCLPKYPDLQPACRQRISTVWRCTWSSSLASVLSRVFSSVVLCQDPHVASLLPLLLQLNKGSVGLVSSFVTWSIASLFYLLFAQKHTAIFSWGADDVSYRINIVRAAGDNLSPSRNLAHVRVEGLMPHHNSEQSVVLITQSVGRSRDTGKHDMI